MADETKTKRKGKLAEPPLEDARWVPLRGVYEALLRRTGNTNIASIDLTEVLCNGKVRVSRRSIHTGEREHAPTYFAELCMEHGKIVRRVDFEKGRNWEFYVWAPDVAKCWPELKQAAGDEGDTSTTKRRKPGPQPRHDWPTVIARELIRRAKAGEKDPTAAELAQFCQDNLDWQPDISALQKQLQKLLG